MPRKRRTVPQEDTSILPLDMVQSILVRLPVKSILRFKSVCRRWNNVISNPHFTKIQAQTSSASPGVFLVLQSPIITEPNDSHKFCLLKFENQRFQIETVLDIPLKSAFILSSCNGIVLLYKWDGDGRNYMLWNPCSRLHTNIILPCHRQTEFYDICHDPTTDDYKIMAFGHPKKKLCSVYSCREKKWIKRNEKLPYCKSGFTRNGVYVDGVVYWLCYSIREPQEAIFFDGIHDKWGKIQLPCSISESSHSYKRVHLFSVRGCLSACSYFINEERSRLLIRISIIENNGDIINSCKWMTVLEYEADEFLTFCEKPPCPIDDNIVVVFVDNSKYVVFDICQEEVIGEIQVFPITRASTPFKCQDHLLFPPIIKSIRPWRKCRRAP